MNRKKLLVIVLPVLFLAGAHGVLAKTMTMTSMASNESQCNSWIADKQKTGVTCYTSNGGSYTTTDITGSYNPYATGTNTCTITYECAGTIVVSGHGNENPAVNPINANYNTAASAKINPPVVTAAPAVPTVTLPWINTAADCTLQNNKSFGVCLAGKTGSPVLVKCAYGPACVCQVDSSKCGVIKMNPNASLLSVGNIDAVTIKSVVAGRVSVAAPVTAETPVVVPSAAVMKVQVAALTAAVNTITTGKTATQEQLNFLTNPTKYLAGVQYNFAQAYQRLVVQQ